MPGDKDKPGKLKPKKVTLSDYVYKGPEKGVCTGQTCSDIATDLFNEVTGENKYNYFPTQDSWFFRAAMKKNNGIVKYDPSNGNTTSYDELPAFSQKDLESKGSNFDIVTMERGVDHSNEVSAVKGYSASDNDNSDHTGIIINTPNGKRIYHGYRGKYQLSKLNDDGTITLNQGVASPLTYKIKGIYASDKVNKYNKEITQPLSPEEITIDPADRIDFKKSKATGWAKRYFTLLDDNDIKQVASEFNVSPKDVYRAYAYGAGIINNETGNNSNIGLFFKENAASLAENIGLKNNSPSVGAFRMKQRDLMTDNTKYRHFNNLGATNDFAKAKDNVTKASVKAFLANFFVNKERLIKNSDNQYNEKTNTIYGDIPVDYAAIYQHNSPSTNLKRKNSFKQRQVDIMKDADKYYVNSALDYLSNMGIDIKDLSDFRKVQKVRTDAEKKEIIDKEAKSYFAKNPQASAKGTKNRDPLAFLYESYQEPKKIEPKPIKLNAKEAAELRNKINQFGKGGITNFENNNIMEIYDNGGPKKRKARKKLNEIIVPNNYGIYSGIIDETGKAIDNPTESQAIHTMVEYMKNNWKGISNVYRPQFMHVGVNYDKNHNNATVPIASNGMGIGSALENVMGGKKKVSAVLQRLMNEGSSDSGASGIEQQTNDSDAAGRQTGKDNLLEKGNVASDMIDTGLGVVTNAIGAFTDPGPYTKGAKGEAIGGGIGAAAGMLIGMPGVGKMVGGTIGKLIGGSKDRKNMLNDIFEDKRNQYANNTLQVNMDKFGNQYAEGGATSPEQPLVQPSTPAIRRINVERNELMVDGETGEIVQKFNNPNRFSPHKKSQMMEPMGNFINVPDNMVIIPKKLASRYERGDKLSRNSIIRELLSKQYIDPMHNVPEEQKTGVSQYAGGGGTSSGDPIIESAFRKVIQNMSKSGILDDPNRKATWHIGDEFDYGLNPDNPTFNPNAQTDPTIAARTGKLKNDKEDNDEEGNVFSKILRNGTANLPIYTQMAVNAQGDPFLNKHINMGFDEAISLAGQLPEEVSIAGNLFNNDNSFAGAVKAINNNDTPSARAEAGELYSRKLAADNAAFTAGQATSAQMKTNKLNALLGLNVQQGADQEAANNLFMNEQRMDKAARENNTNEALANLTINSQKRDNDLAMVDAINAVSNFFDIDPYGKSMLREDPKSVAFILNYMKSNTGKTIKDAISEYEKQKQEKQKQEKQSNQKKVKKGIHG